MGALKITFTGGGSISVTDQGKATLVRHLAAHTGYQFVDEKEYLEFVQGNVVPSGAISKLRQRLSKQDELLARLEAGGNSAYWRHVTTTPRAELPKPRREPVEAVAVALRMEIQNARMFA